MTTPADDDFTVLEDADFPRVDLVSRPANGSNGWLVMKAGSETGLLDAEFVRDLITKAEPEEAPVAETDAGETTLPNGIVIKGSPAAMAAFIHAASRRADDGEDVAKADMSTASVNDLDDDQFAYVESGGKKDDSGKTTPRSLRHFPINDKAHIRNALARAPQSPFGDKAMPKIRAAAKREGIDVAKEASVPDTVTKDMELDGDPDVMDALDVTVPLAEPEDMAPGDPMDPGSPAWESIDAATAQKWLSVAARLKNALCCLAEREMLEAASADPDDIEHAWDLEDAKCAVEYAIEQLAVFAATEQSEAELGAEMAEIGKALYGTAIPLGVIEELGPVSVAVRKAGRVLSAQNEAAIRAAAESLQKVLASLPEAPVAKEAAMSGTQSKAAVVAKETASPEQQARDTGPVNAGGTTGLGEPRKTGPEPALPGDGPQQARPGDVPGRTVVKSALKVLVYDRHGNARQASPDAIRTSIAKADGDSDGPVTMQAVFDAEGDLVGIVDPADITPVSGAGGSSGDDDGDASADAAPAPAADDMTPQPPADAGTPADGSDGVVKAAPDSDTPSLAEVLKSITEGQAASTANQAVLLEAVAKMAAGNEELASQVEVLKARLAVVEEQPAAPKVFANGQVPPAHMLRGQDHGAAREVDVTKARERKAELYAASGPEAARIAKEMQGDAIAHLEALHAGR